MTYNPDTWTEETTQELVRYLEEKRANPMLSMDIIGKRMGIGRSAICGKVRRLREAGLIDQAPFPSPAGGWAAGMGIRKERKPMERKPPTPTKDLTPIPMMEPLKPHGEAVGHGECPYVYGDPRSKDWQYCGRRSVRPGVVVWCEGHKKGLRL